MDWEGAIQQLIQNQQNFGQAFTQFLTHQANVAPAAAGPIPAKKIVASPEAYDGSPQKFHEWWSKVKVWVTTTNQQKAVAVYLHLEGPRAGHFTQVCLDECMAANMWPTWAELQTEIEAFFLPGNNKEWARSQLLCLCQGPCQRINDFLAQFQALKLQSECPDEYAKDLLERVVTRKILEQVYMQGLDRTTWVQVREAVRTIGRAQELFLINTTTPTWYFSTNHYTSSSGTPSGSGAPMDIGAANTRPQHGKGIHLNGPGNKDHSKDGLYSPRNARLLQEFKRLESDDETGIITLESELNTALHILDYRLSLTKDKKTHKKFTTSVSSLDSVSPNKYTSLVVEDVDTRCTTDCVDTSASFVSPFTSATVPSTGVPKSGSAPDVKRGVLNSHVSINGQNSPSLASSDSESPANDLEVGFLVELRRTITMEREVQILVQVRGPVNTIEVEALLDRIMSPAFQKLKSFFKEHFYRLKAPGVEEEEDCGYHPMRRLL
ncbi:hypothetical protein SCLCIDRAFT_23317 [Scleroderma citrinum Foug A]|uniref:Retrotransposon gag domain-containing protein n=1 Tax=Scleroderma citrinum Foug A TaxID=1036808 RepID=A0A0C3DVH2_9AGAM|nr:hypothetical protein SCLCIDRAFT_23317 [Scleroderma citrinum Foug A]